jgi:hypothetical protein
MLLGDSGAQGYRSNDYSPADDSIVRVQACQLHLRLIPGRSYIAVFHNAGATDDAGQTAPPFGSARFRSLAAPTGSERPS